MSVGTVLFNPSEIAGLSLTPLNHQKGFVKRRAEKRNTGLMNQMLFIGVCFDH